MGVRASVSAFVPPLASQGAAQDGLARQCRLDHPLAYAGAWRRRTSLGRSLSWPTSCCGGAGHRGLWVKVA